DPEKPDKPQRRKTRPIRKERVTSKPVQDKTIPRKDQTKTSQNYLKHPDPQTIEDPTDQRQDPLHLQ
ncbi:486_t:CDS:1, partial [Gigaspora rosea]